MIIRINDSSSLFIEANYERNLMEIFNERVSLGQRQRFENFAVTIIPLNLYDFGEKMSPFFEATNNWKRTAVTVSVVLAVTEIAWHIYKSKWWSKSWRRKRAVISEVLFFSDESNFCLDHAISRVPCHRSHCAMRNLRQITSRLDSARKTLDVCVYMLTLDDLASAIHRAFLRGVVVRIIIDGDMSENTACERKVRWFKERGIKVRTKKSPHLMHHKFAVVDEEVLISGSSNWTRQAIHGNFDNVLITNDPEIVDSFAKEFRNIWSIFTSGEN